MSQINVQWGQRGNATVAYHSPSNLELYIVVRGEPRNADPDRTLQATSNAIQPKWPDHKHSVYAELR